jgi:hypothetical protein
MDGHDLYFAGIDQTRKMFKRAVKAFLCIIRETAGWQLAGF